MKKVKVMKKNTLKALVFVVVMAVALTFAGCNEGKKEYAFTTQRPKETMMPTITYGCDIYTADLSSLKKMSGTVYNGGAFGEIKDEQTAVDCAVKALTDIYGKKALDGFLPLVVTFNDRAGCWIVHGTPKDNLNTGMSFAALRKATGEVVMVLKNPEKDG